MIRKASEMKSTFREQMYGGDKTVELLHIVEKEELNHARLFSKVTIPVGGSVGTHPHHNETEYYYILTGTGTVDEGSGEIAVGIGDVVVTGDSEQHNIRNTGEIPLEFLAVIILDD
jgi:mannose-6-phosphate isomerase-like protein (cupin superfamily)